MTEKLNERWSFTALAGFDLRIGLGDIFLEFVYYVLFLSHDTSVFYRVLRFSSLSKNKPWKYRCMS